MYRIVGLWNNEEKYYDTAHNIGGQILFKIFRKKELKIFDKTHSSFLSSKRNAKVSEGIFCNQRFEIIFPEGFINESGIVFSGVFSKENQDDKKKIIIIYDDLALPFGKVKISFGRGDGGHNGIKDIIKKLGTKDFIRIRVGVCPLNLFGNARKPKGEAVTKYLINKKFTKKYKKKIQLAEKKIEEILEEILKNGWEKSANKFN